MDERALFDRFHEALDIEPRPGAYERLSSQLTNQPVALARRPVFRMRFSKMTFRVAAALVAVLLAIALIATFVTVHNRPVGEIPAHTDQNLKAYGAMLDADYGSMTAASSGHCLTIQDHGCAAATVPVIESLRKWINDLKAFHTPSQLVALDAVFQAHLQDAIDDLNAAVTFQQSGDVTGFNLAVNAALYERAWIDPADSGLQGTYPNPPTSYLDVISLVRLSVLGCLGSTPNAAEFPCHRLQSYESCAGALAIQCEGDLQNEDTNVEVFLVDMTERAAPSSLARQYAGLKADLVRIDGALLAIHAANLHGDSSAANRAEGSFVSAMAATETDLSQIH